MLIVSAPPRVLSPKTGFEPGRSCIEETAFFGSRSQLTMSANASLMRTPSWKTDSPCGVPRSADAVNPRKLTSGWYELPVGELSDTLLALRLRNSATPPVRCRSSSRAPNVCTLDGTCSSGVPSPGRGAVPMTSIGPRGTTGCSCASAAAHVAVPANSSNPIRISWTTSADGDAPRQLADGDLRDFRVGVGVDHRDGVGPPAGDVKLLSIGRERHVPGTLAHGDPGHDRVARRVDHLHGAFAAGGHEHPLAVGMHDHAVRALARLDARDHVVRLRVEHVDGVRIFGGHVRTAAVGQEADATRAIAHLDRLDDLALGKIDDIDGIGFFGADVEPFAVGTEDCILWVLAAHSHAASHFERR